MTRGPEQRTVVIQEDLPIALTIAGADLFKGDLTEIQFGSGRIAVHAEEADLTPSCRRVATLASIGMSNLAIAKSLYNSEDTIKAHLRRTFQQSGIVSRSGIARHFISEGVYEIQAKGEPLGLNEKQQQIVDLYSHGLEQYKVGAKLGISRDRVKYQLQQIGKRNRLAGGEEVVMAALLSGEVS